ncbi:MAG: endonuclease/exonuclease/phosphatase family protein [Ardenticatenales bacterium]|nr:endonuclease/exonuclease/phosphatase family protein [Ardenticatenales bacterium]
MPFYSRLRTHPARERVAERLLALRAQLRAEIPPRRVTETLLLASWNIRDFDSNKFGHGPRLPESFYYIAEIISAFDLVAVQEVNRNLSALKEVMRILGPDWTYMVTDTTEGRAGNQERMAFVYDKSKILFRNIVGEIVIPDSEMPSGQRQFARSPFFVSFQSGWFKFSLCTVHIYYGSDSGEALEQRIAEIDQIAGFIAKRAKSEPGNFILLGDFNIVSPEHRTMQALTEHDFIIPKPLQGLPTNMFGTKHYDQIAFRVREGELELGDSPKPAGVLQLYNSVFRPEEYGAYQEFMDPKKRDISEKGETLDEKGKQKYYEGEWRTFQMSDHLPLWVELKIDFSDQYLRELAAQK